MFDSEIEILGAYYEEVGDMLDNLADAESEDDFVNALEDLHCSAESMFNLIKQMQKDRGL